jgi:hypothetical protein
LERRELGQMARISVKPLNSGRFALMERTHDFGLIP